MIDLVTELKGAGGPQDLAFPQSEYITRVAKVRKAMEAAGLEILLVHNTPNLCYLTGYQTPLGSSYACLVLPRDEEASMQILEEQVGLIPLNGWVKQIVTIPERQSREAPEHLIQLLRKRGFAEKEIGVELNRYPLAAATYLALREGLPRARFQDASRLIFNLRLVKSRAEIVNIRQAAQFTNVGMRAALQEIRLGNTDNDIGAGAYAAMVRAGSEAPYPAPFVMSGQRSGWGPHLSWKRFRLRAGDPISLELTGVYHRYVAPLYRTAIIGKPSEQLKRIADACITTVNLVLENARPGRSAHDVARAASKGLHPILTEVYHAGQFGYAVGLALAPNWVEHSFRIIEGAERPLEPGMVFHSPIAVRIPGTMAAGFSETWTVTETGYEVLTNMPRELLVVDG